MEKKALIVTRHPALVEYLNEIGIEGELLSHATEEAVAGKRVYGVLPLRLACLCETFTEVSLTLAPEQRGKELTLEEIKNASPELVTYRVERVTPVIL